MSGNTHTWGSLSGGSSALRDSVFSKKSRFDALNQKAESLSDAIMKNKQEIERLKGSTYQINPISLFLRDSAHSPSFLEVELDKSKEKVDLVRRVIQVGDLRKQESSLKSEMESLSQGISSLIEKEANLKSEMNKLQDISNSSKQEKELALNSLREDISNFKTKLRSMSEEGPFG